MYVRLLKVIYFFKTISPRNGKNYDSAFTVASKLAASATFSICRRFINALHEAAQGRARPEFDEPRETLRQQIRAWIFPTAPTT